MRRWENFGRSGAKLIWGGEAVAVEPSGRANPNQLYYRRENEKGLAELLGSLRREHKSRYGSCDDLIVGLQLTHSGRFCRPDEHGRLEPRTAHVHPQLDTRFGIDPEKAMLSDAEIDGLIERFVVVARAAAKLGFDFVDIKHCHGYLMHEILAAKTRSGMYGGSFENRTRVLREIVAGIRRDAPSLQIGVRLSIYDQPPVVDRDTREHTFGLMSDDLLTWDREEPIRFLELCRDLKISMVNLTAGSPYYCAHLQRPAAFPPVDSSEPQRRDPLAHCLRQIQIAGECKKAVPDLPMVGTAYSYFQEYLPHVAQAEVRAGHIDLIGLGRVVLSYPTLPDDVLARGVLTRNRICRTFSDCTNGPRMGFISGCFPLDPAYRELPEWKQIQARKKQLAEEKAATSSTGGAPSPAH